MAKGAKFWLVVLSSLLGSVVLFSPVSAARPSLRDLLNPDYFSFSNLQANFQANVAQLAIRSERYLSQAAAVVQNTIQHIAAGLHKDAVATIPAPAMPLAQLNSILPEAPVSSPSPDTSPTTDSLETKVSNLQGLVSQVQDLIALNQQTKSTALTQPVLNNPIVTSTTDDVKNLIAQLQQKQEADRRALFQAIAMSNRINQISNVTISNPTFAALSITDSDVPDTITASNYLPLSGGTITGNLTVTGTCTGCGSSGGSADWQKESNFNTLTLTPTTTIPIWLKSALYASSTVTIQGATGIGTTTPAKNFAVHGDTFVTGTSTVGNLLATSTITTTNLNVTGTCTGCGATGLTYDWQKESNFGTLTLTPTTTIPLWAKSAIYASSTLTVNGPANFNTITATSTLDVTGLSTLGGFISTASSTAQGNFSAGGLSLNVDATNVRVGIGTSTPKDSLDIYKSGTGALAMQRLSFNGAIGNIGGSMGFWYAPTNAEVARMESFVENGSSGSLRFYTFGAAALTEKLRITGDGNIGIATTTPRWTLQVASSTRPQLVLTDTAATTDQQHWAMRSSRGNLYFATSTDSYATSTVPAVIFDVNGNLGVGTSSPATKLSVIGKSMFNGNLLGLTSAGFGGTSTPARTLGVHGDAYFTGAIRNVSNITATGTVTLAGFSITYNSSTGVNTFYNANFSNADADFLFQPSSGSNANGTTMNIGAGYFNGPYGTARDLKLSSTFAPPAASTEDGTAMEINNTYTFDAASTGVPRGIYINPTLTAITDQVKFRALEIAPNSGFGIYQSQLNPVNYFGGKIAVGTSSTKWVVDIAGTTTKPQLALTDINGGTNLKHWTLASQGGNFYLATSTDSYATSTVPAFMINSNAQVGIGTSSPAAKLSIEGKCTDIDVGCADFAELYPASEDVMPGDILAFDQTSSKTVRKAAANDRDLLAGVVSTNPAIVIEGSALQLLTGTNYHSNPRNPALALAGRIPVKVNMEGGEIKIGDPITISSTPGVGKKATESGKIIGYALESYNGGDGSIIVFSNLNYWNNGSATQNSFASGSIVGTMQSWLTSWGVAISDGLLAVKNLVADKIVAPMAELLDLKVGSSEKPSGITVFDVDTKQPYCVRVRSGALENIAGECGATNITPPPIIDNTSNNTDNASTTPNSEIASTTAPIIEELESTATTTEPIIVSSSEATSTVTELQSSTTPAIE